MKRLYKILVLSDRKQKNEIIKLLGIKGMENDISPLIEDIEKGCDYRFYFSYSIESTISMFRSEPFHGMILHGELDDSMGIKFFEVLTKISYKNRHITPEQVLVLFLKDTPSTATILRLGRLRAGDLFQKRSGKRKGESSSIFSALHGILRPSKKGKTAVCLAGGGIEGLIYELGVLRLIDDIIVGKSIIDFDLFYGISAGSVISATMANGIPPGELARAFMLDSTIISPVKSTSLFDPAFGEIGGRLLNFLTGTFENNGWIVQRLLNTVPNGFFKGDKIEKLLAKGFSTPGRTNNFEDLNNKLFIGATDQDTSEHIVFGTPGWKHVPISKAIHASMALIPFYAPQFVSGRWFIDGSFTRTSEIELAIAHGATLIIIVDPLIPIKADTSGFVKEKGGMFSTIQSLKALVNTRFDSILPHLVESHPEVDFFVFKPQDDDMRIMSGMLMKYRYRMEIERIAHDAALKRLKEEHKRSTEAFARHGMTIDLSSD